MKYIITMITLVLVVISISGCAGKFRGGDMGSRIYNKYDKTSEGLITQESYEKVAVSRFERIDLNSDGNATKQESKKSRFGKFMPGIMSYWFKKNDINSDDIVEKPEMLTTSDIEFKAIDTNNDNLVSKDEMKTYHKNEIFDRIDLNNDEVISRKEFINAKSPFEK
ncbi:hypothetical protein [Sulfurimonas sp.]|uniref:EF-hand domain-containing protein n=1 Tax=Sulfurimonas sp. TaxID=2022749 RepID=UPI002B48FC93|nr:hypothetical protein [Sulfurimonas sp.]